MSPPFLVKYHSLISPSPLRLLSRLTMPLFQLSVYDLRPYLTSENKRSRLFRQPKAYYLSKQYKQFDRLLCVSANIGRNCRRGKLINMKRNVLLEWFDMGKNKQLTKGKCFNIVLGKVNYVVDDNQLTTQLTLAMEYADRKIINENPSMGKKHHISNTNYNSRNSLNQSPLLVIHNLLSNLTLTSWTSFLSQNFSKSPNTIRLLQLQNSYMNVSITNYYRIKYSQLPQLLYEDMKDFDKMLNKFNFLRFFITSGNDNVIRAQKNCHLLIKNIQWRTQQSQEYLLLLLRNNSWERVCITVHNFCTLYQIVNNKNTLNNNTLKQKLTKLT